MKSNQIIFKGLSLIVILSFFSCGSNYKHSFTEEEINNVVSKSLQHPIILQKKGIKISEINDYPRFSDVSLNLLTDNVRFRLGKNNLEFDIKKFNLGERTVEENNTGFKLNKSGQNLCVITNSEDPNYYYSERVEKYFEKTDKYLFAYLSRSYGVSLKAKTAYGFYKLEMNESDGNLVRETKQKLIYLNSPSQGDIFSKNSKILLDFFLVNHTIKEQRGYLELSINDVSFVLNKWAPFSIEGLDYGKYRVQLKAFTKEGKEIETLKMKNSFVDFEVKEEAVFE